MDQPKQLAKTEALAHREDILNSQSHLASPGLPHQCKMLGRVSGKGDHPLFRIVTLVFFAAASFCGSSGIVRAQVNAVKVNRAVERGIAYLRKEQQELGGWEEFNKNHSCGLSALCTLALLNAGVSREDPTIVKAMKYLRTNEPTDTYSVSLQTLVYCQLGAAGDGPRIRNNAKWLIDAQLPTGGWTYGAKRFLSGDPSNAQFAILALGAAQDRGVQINPAVFEGAIRYWTNLQSSRGGWSYTASNPTGSMTCAGIASLIIANGRLGNASSDVVDGSIQCCGGDASEQDPIAKGLDWLGRNFNSRANPGGSSGTYYYYLYAIERTGRLSGRRFFGGHDWYREGAERLLAEQDEFQGYWANGNLADAWERPTVATSFALLFLSKGKRQVVAGQLQRENEDPKQWQPHPDSLRQLVRHVERAWGRDLTWQTVTLKNASVVDLLQTPVLVISGKQALDFDQSQSALLKDYIDQGGTILFDASGDHGCGNAANFQNSVANLCAKWYPDAPLERLPATHPVWNAERNADIGAMPNGFWVYGVQACCRTAVFYVPQSLTCRWELGDRLFRRGDGDDPARKQIDHAIRIGQNIIAYATGRELKDKLDERMVLTADSLPTTQRGATRIARLDVGAGGQEARRAIPNAATIVRNQTHVALSVPDEPVGFQPKDLAEVSVLWIHGRRDFQFTGKQVQTIREFIANGGVVFGTAICGDEAFTEAFRREFAKVLVDTPLQSMPTDHPMLSTRYYGYDLRSVAIRKISQGSAGQQVRRQQSPPQLEFAEADGIVTVVFSPLDVSCALESQNSVQCPGYSTEDAAKIITNVVQMALNQ